MDENSLLRMQRNQRTEYEIYRRLADLVPDPSNRRIMKTMSEKERIHYDALRSVTGKDADPNRMRIAFYVFAARTLGITFSLKLLERNIGSTISFTGLPIKETDELQHDERIEEMRQLGLLDEKSLRYTGSIALGLSDALVELTGALAGFTLALRDPMLVAVTGTITGIAAALSMTASAYLSRAEDRDPRIRPLRSAAYTGIAYFIVVALLVFPNFLFSNVFLSLGTTILIGISLIMAFTFYTSVAKDLNFRVQFLRMVLISGVVTLISFTVGIVLREVVGFTV